MRAGRAATPKWCKFATFAARGGEIPERCLMKLLLRSLLPLLAALLLAACGPRIEGTYADPTGLSKYEFQSGGKVYVSVLGAKTELKYEVDGKNVKIIGSSGNQVLTLLDDGSLQGPLGIKLKKQP